jgi:uncharacterized protein YutE (UPF0331/DUF86 family)
VWKPSPLGDDTVNHRRIGQGLACSSTAAIAPGTVVTDLPEERFVAHTLQLALQAMLDVASHIVSDRCLGEPETDRQFFALMARDGWIPVPLVTTLGKMVRFRSVLVHCYWAVDLRTTRYAVEHQLSDPLTTLTRSPSSMRFGKGLLRLKAKAR